MRIGITTFGGDAGKSGISRYITCLVRAMVELDRSIELEVLVHRAERDVYAVPGLRALEFPGWTRAPVADIAWHSLALPAVAAARKYDVLFLPAANRRLPVALPCPSVGTFHDIATLHVEGKYDRLRRRYLTWVLPTLVRRLDHVLAVSEATRRDVVERLDVPEHRVTVVPNGVDLDQFDVGSEADPGQSTSRRSRRRPYLLYVSRIEHPGKNHVALLDAFSELKRTDGIPHQLLLAGSDWLRADEVHRAAARSPAANDIRFLGFVPDDDLPDLYRNADIFVFPSRFEGFGLPLLEAMASGTPVACSNVSSIPEVAGDAAEYFDPGQPAAIASAVRRLLNDHRLRRDLVRRGLERSRRFSWTRTAERTLEILCQTMRRAT